MIRKIALTMRIDTHHYTSGTCEERDALAHDWSVFLKKILPDTPWFPVANMGTNAVYIVESFGINALILTGGNSVGHAIQRDTTEMHLLRWAIQHHFPVLGVCRGAQMLHTLLGGVLSLMPQKHIATSHPVYLENKTTLHVNSYHEYGIFSQDLADELVPIAHADDGTIEAFRHEHYPWLGLMWHPEREADSENWTCTQIQNLFCV